MMVDQISVVYAIGYWDQKWINPGESDNEFECYLEVLFEL